MASPQGGNFEKHVSFATNAAEMMASNSDAKDGLSPKDGSTDDDTASLKSRSPCGSPIAAESESIPSTMSQLRKELDRVTKPTGAGDAEQRKRAPWSSMTCFSMDNLCMDPSFRGAENALATSPRVTEGKVNLRGDAPGQKFHSNLYASPNDSIIESTGEDGGGDGVDDEDAFLPDADEAFLPSTGEEVFLPPDEEEAFLPPDDSEAAFLPDITDEDFIPQDESAFLPTLEVEIDPMEDANEFGNHDPSNETDSPSKEALLDQDEEDNEECPSPERCSNALGVGPIDETCLEEPMEADELVDGRTEMLLEEHTKKLEEMGGSEGPAELNKEEETEELTEASSNEESPEETRGEEPEGHLNDPTDEIENHVDAAESNEPDVVATDENSIAEAMEEPNEIDVTDTDDNCDTVAMEEIIEREVSGDEFLAEDPWTTSPDNDLEETESAEMPQEDPWTTSPDNGLEETESAEMPHDDEKDEPDESSGQAEDETTPHDNDLEERETVEMPDDEERVETDESSGQDTDETTPVVSPNTSDDTAAQDEINELRLQLQNSEEEKRKAVSDAVKQIESRLRSDSMKEVVKVAQSAKIAHSVRLSSAEKVHVEREQKLRQENKQQVMRIAGAMKVANAVRSEFAADEEFGELRTLKNSLGNLLNNQKATIESLQSSVAEKDNQIEELEAELSQSRQQEQEASSSLRVAEKTLISVKAELTTTRAAKRDLEKSLEEAKQKIEALQSALDKAEHSLEEASSQLQIGEKRKEAIEELEAERDNLKSSVENLQQENAEMRTLTNHQSSVIVENEASILELSEKVEQLQITVEENHEVKQLFEQQKESIQMKDRSLEEMKNEIRGLLESVNRADTEKQDLETQHEQHLQVLNEKVRSLSEDSQKLKTILSSSRSRGSVYCTNSDDTDDFEANYQTTSASNSGDGTGRESSSFPEDKAVGVRTCVAAGSKDSRRLSARSNGMDSRDYDEVDPIFSAASSHDFLAENGRQGQNINTKLSISTKKCKEELTKMDKTAAYKSAAYDKLRCMSCGCYTPSSDLQNTAEIISMSNSIADNDTTVVLTAKEQKSCVVEPEIRTDETSQGVEMAVSEATSSDREEAEKAFDRALAAVVIEDGDDADMDQIEAVLNAFNPVGSSTQKSEKSDTDAKDELETNKNDVDVEGSNLATKAQTSKVATTEDIEKATSEEVSEDHAAAAKHGACTEARCETVNETSILEVISDVIRQERPGLSLQLNDYIDGNEVIPMTKKLESLSAHLMKILSQPEQDSPKNVLEEKVGMFKVAMRTLQREKEKALKEKDRALQEKDRAIEEMREKLAKHEKQSEDKPNNETRSRDENSRPHSLTIMTAHSEDSLDQPRKQNLAKKEGVSSLTAKHSVGEPSNGSSQEVSTKTVAGPTQTRAVPKQSAAHAASTPNSNQNSKSVPVKDSGTTTRSDDRKETKKPATTPRVPLHLRSTTPGANASAKQPKSVVAKSSTGMTKGPSKRSSIQPPTPTSSKRSSTPTSRRSSIRPPTPTSSIRPPTPTSRRVANQPTPTPTSARLGKEAKGTSVKSVISKLEKKCVTPSASSGIPVGKKASRLPKPPTRAYSGTKVSKLSQPQRGPTPPQKRAVKATTANKGRTYADGNNRSSKGVPQPQAAVPSKPPVQHESTHSQQRPTSIATSDLQDSFASLLKTRDEISTPLSQSEPKEKAQESRSDDGPGKPTNEHAAVEEKNSEIHPVGDVSPSSVTLESASSREGDLEPPSEALQEEERAAETGSENVESLNAEQHTAPSTTFETEEVVPKELVADEHATIESIPSEPAKTPTSVIQDDEEARSDNTGRQLELDERDSIPCQDEGTKNEAVCGATKETTTDDDAQRDAVEEEPASNEIEGSDGATDHLNDKGAAILAPPKDSYHPELELLNAEISGTSDDLDFTAESDEESCSPGEKPSKAIQLE